MSETSDQEPCLCGDPECPRCFPPFHEAANTDADAVYEQWRERRSDDEARDDIRLINDLNMMIASVAKTNAFDKRDMENLLKRARDRIYDR